MQVIRCFKVYAPIYISRLGEGGGGHWVGVWHFRKKNVDKFHRPGGIFCVKSTKNFPPREAQSHHRQREKIKLPYSGDNKISQKHYPRAKNVHQIWSPPYALPPLPPPHRLNIDRCIKNPTNSSGDIKIAVVSYIYLIYVTILS